MITLDEYKNYLINYYHHNCDNMNSKRLERKRNLEQRYTDDDLQLILNNTFEFIYQQLERMIQNKTTYNVWELINDGDDINTNCTGGWSPDRIIQLEDETGFKLISLYLLKKFLGNKVRVSVEYHEIEYVDDDDQDMIIGAVYLYPELIISGEYSILEEKYKSIKDEKQNELKRKLEKKI